MSRAVERAMTDECSPIQFGTPPPSPVIQLNDTTSMTFRVTDLEFFHTDPGNSIRIVLGFRSGYRATIQYPSAETRTKDVSILAIKMSQFPK